MGKVSGLASSRKRHRKAPPAKVTPEKDEELVADDDDPWPSLEEMYVMLIDRVVEQVMIRTLDFYMRATIEDVISIRYHRLCKYEAMAVACREVLERRLRLVEHPSWCEPFQDAYEKAIDELAGVQLEEQEPKCDSCGLVTAHCDCRFKCECGATHVVFEWRLGFTRGAYCTIDVGYVGGGFV